MIYQAREVQSYQNASVSNPFNVCASDQIFPCLLLPGLAIKDVKIRYEWVNWRIGGLSCTLVYPQNSASIHRGMDYKVSKAFHRDAGPRRVQYFPQLCQFDLIWSWLDALWVVDYSWYTRETVKLEKSSNIVVLDTLKSVRLAPTTIQRHLHLLSCPFILPNGTHI
jgi:hypothetical protein